jgi:hypothetical protein
LYFKSAETSRMVGGDEGAGDLSLCTSCTVFLKLLHSYFNHPKALVGTELYHYQYSFVREDRALQGGGG